MSWLKNINYSNIKKLLKVLTIKNLQWIKNANQNSRSVVGKSSSSSSSLSSSAKAVVVAYKFHLMSIKNPQIYVCVCVKNEMHIRMKNCSQEHLLTYSFFFWKYCRKSFYPYAHKRIFSEYQYLWRWIHSNGKQY